MKNRKKILLAAVGVIAALALALYAAIFASAGLPGQTKTEVSAAFANVGGLRVGDDVREASKRVGRVESITVVGDHAVARLMISGDQQVHADAKAAIWARSGLGQNFVELDTGSTTAGPIGSRIIPMNRTLSPTDLDQLLDVLDKPTRSALSSALRQAGGGMEGKSQAIADFLATAPGTLTDLQRTSTALADPHADLAGLLSATRDVARHFRGHQTEVSSVIRQTAQTLRAVGAQHAQPIGQALDAAPAALGGLRTGLATLDQPLRDLGSASKTLRTGARSLGRSTPDLRSALRAAVNPFDKVPSVAGQATTALQRLTPAMSAFRPLAERLEYTFAISQSAAAYMAPYAPELADFFDYWHSANGSSDKDGHFLRLGFVVRPETLDGALPIRDPLTHRNPYPAPGQAQRDRAAGVIGGY